MARANLNVHSDVELAFKNAQNADSMIRAITVKVEGEALVLGKSIERIGNYSEDFGSVFSNCLVADTASFVLYCQTDEFVSGKKWIFICYIPDNAKVRDKMLYSSSVEDLKRTLGLGYFSQDYACSVPEDLTWTFFLTAVENKDLNSVLTSSERQIKEEVLQSRNESNMSKSTAMGVLSFAFDDDALVALEQFRNNEVSWVELSVSDEMVRLAASTAVNCNGDDSVLRAGAQNLGNEPRFCLYRHATVAVADVLTDLTDLTDTDKQVVFFIFYCPEESSARIKMTMSASKAAVVARLQEAGVIISIGCSLEVREKVYLESEVLTRVREQQRSGDIEQQNIGSDAGAGGSGSGGNGSLSPVTALNKPARPGRGKAKVSKFIPDPS